MRVLVVITLLLSSIMAFAAEKTTEVFTLDHQMSTHCEKKIKENLRFEKGISKIDVSLKANTITITYDAKKTDTEKIIDAFRKIGFTAYVYGTQPGAAKEEGSCGGHSQPEGTCTEGGSCGGHSQPEGACPEGGCKGHHCPTPHIAIP